MKLLCFHGKYQNRVVFASKMAKLEQKLQDVAKLVYVNGPLTVLPKIVRDHRRLDSSQTSQYRAWWKENCGLLDRDLIHCIREVLDEHGPFDGVIGFSQGALLSSILCTNKVSSLIGWNPHVALLFGSYQVNSVEFESGIVKNLRSMHVYGTNDNVVPCLKSQEVANVFKKYQEYDDQVVTLEHDQGHIIPTNSHTLDEISLFLEFSRMTNYAPQPSLFEQY